MRAALREFYTQRPWARRDASGEAINDIRMDMVFQLCLRTNYEARPVRYSSGASVRMGAPVRAACDPWLLDHVSFQDAPLGKKVSVTFEDFAVVGSCQACDDGKQPCPFHLGDSCPSCRGREYKTCVVCNGRGRFVAHPTVDFTRDVMTSIQIATTVPLPSEVRRSLELAVDGSEPVHTQNSDLNTALSLPSLSAGYRINVAVESDMESLASAMLRCVAVPKHARVRGQRLEFRNVKLWHVHVPEVGALCVYGTPPKVFPSLALTNRLGRTLGRLIGG